MRRSLTVAVMQPYWAPYAGYFRLWAAADIVVLFDDVQFPRRGWVHRFKVGERWITLPVEKAPRDTRICDMKLEDGLNLGFYLSETVLHNIEVLGLKKLTLRSCKMNIDPALRAQERVIAICQQLGATRYVNASGGRDLYDAPTFASFGMELGFLKRYEGNYDSILIRLLTEKPEDIAAEIRRETVIEWMS